MSIIQKDITYLESEKELPDTFNKQGDFLRVKTDGSGETEWLDPDTSEISFNKVLLGDGTALSPSLSFQNEANNDSGIYRDAENSVSISAGGLQRLQVTNSNVTVGTTTNNADLIVRGNIATNRYFAGDNLQGTPSYSFTNTNGTDTGMYYIFDTQDRLRFSAGGSFVMEMNSGQSFLNNRLLANNSLSNNTTPAVIFHNDSSTTGYSGQRTNPSTDPRLWAVVSGVQATELTPTQFNVGLNTSNNTNMKTLNQNGSSNFNSYTPDDSLVILPTTTATNGSSTGSYFDSDFDATTGVYAYCNNTSTSGIARIQMTTNPNDLSNWTALTNTGTSVINISNVRSLCFGNGIWACLSHSSGTRQLYWNTTANALTTAWNQAPSSAPWTTGRQINRLRFINGQFITVDNGARFRLSTDCVTWLGDIASNATTNTATDIAYSPELQRYVISTNVGNCYYYNGSTMPTTNNQFTLVSVSGIGSNFITWSPKLSMFLGQNFTTFAFNWSRDGINWNSYTPSSGTWAAIQNCKWVDDYGGFFIAGLNQTTNNVAISRDGLNWTQHTVLTTAVNSLLYNPTAKMFSFFGTTTLARYKDNSTYITSYVSNDNIYNTFNSNTRFADTIEYQSQNITTSAGNNHFTTLMFNRPVINFDTTSSNANIMLQGISYNGRVGTKFTIQKTISSTHNVRIHGYETCRIITPFGVVSNFNHQSSPQTYSIIPAGYFGNFDLSRIDDSVTTGGTWLIDNVDIYDANGVEYKLDDLTVAGNLQANLINVPSSSTPSIRFNTTGSTDYGIGGSSTTTVLYSNNKPIITTGSNSILLFDASWTGELNVENYGSLKNISQTIGSGTFDSDTFNRDSIRVNTSPGNCQINLKVPLSIILGNTKRYHKISTSNKLSLYALGSTITLISKLGIETRNTGSEFTTAFPDTTDKNILFELVYIATDTFYCNILQINTASAVENRLGDTTINGRLIVSDSSVQGTRFDSNVTVTGTFLNFKESIQDITATSGLAVTSANILTYAKHNYIVTSSTDFYIELNNLNNAAFDNTTLYFCGAENYTGTSLYIDNQMGTGNIIKVYKNGGITTLTNTQDTTIDKDQWVRCTYKHNYRGGNNYWLCHEYNSSA
jgi:hypothetical protein